MLRTRLPGFFNRVISSLLRRTSPHRSVARGSPFTYRSQPQLCFFFWEASVQKAMQYTQEPVTHLVDSGMVTHPYSIYIWQPPLSPQDVGHWNEPVQCFTEQWAVYVAGLMH